jgi:hypothetical protein
LDVLSGQFPVPTLVASITPRFRVDQVFRCRRLEQLAAFPSAGRVVPEFGDPKIREILWRNYRLVYRLAGSSLAQAAAGFTSNFSE